MHTFYFFFISDADVYFINWLWYNYPLMSSRIYTQNYVRRNYVLLHTTSQYLFKFFD